MAPLSREPGLGQPAITGMERPVISQESLQGRNSFARAVTPEYHGLLIEDFAELTEEQINFVTPTFLKQSLIGVERAAPNSVYYRNPETNESLWVAVTPQEFKQLGGNVTTLGNRVISHVLNSRGQRRDFTEDRAAAQRGGVHAVTNQLEKLETYQDKTLNKQLAEVRWLRHAADNPGYAWKKGADLRIMMGNVRGIIFSDMLLAMREANSWSPAMATGVEKVLDYRLFFDRSHNKHIGNWRHVLSLADTYLGYKKALYNDKITDAKRFISKYEQ